MKLLNRVLWREGMHLSQHHFQTQGRYIEDTLANALECVLPYSYGFTQLELDTDAIRNGTAVLRSARGLMPDGLPFHMPDSDPLPSPRSVGPAFGPTQQSQLLVLAVAQYEAEGANVGDVGDAGSPRRYRPATRTTRDAVTGADAVDVQLAMREFRLLLDSERAPNEVCVPVARIVREVSGSLAFDKSFVPPCLKLSGSERLLQVVAEILERLESKDATLVAERGNSARDIANYAAHELAGFWMLHTIRKHSASLRHHFASRESHPERVYLDLARLVGELSTFSLHASTHEIPAFVHDDPGPTFATLTSQIAVSLEALASSQVQRYPLVAERPRLHATSVVDARAYWGARWILSVSMERRDALQVARVVPLLKAAARRELPGIVKRGLSALELAPLPVVPAAISPRPGTAYFEVQMTGQWWDGVRDTKELCVFVPDAVEGVSLELYVIRAAP